MRPLDKDIEPNKTDKLSVSVKEYQNYRRYLIDSIGEYCSYCESKINSNLAVEHIRPKTHNPDLELKWDNLLLACVNCNSTKGHQNINVSDYILPNKDNSFNTFKYDNSGKVKVNSSISSSDLIKAKNTINLLGLDKIEPKKDTSKWEIASDRRFTHRLEAYRTANEYSSKYGSSSIDLKEIYKDCIITIVKGQGFWSIWMNAFNAFPEIQKELVNVFPGTRKTYFEDLIK